MTSQQSRSPSSLPPASGIGRKRREEGEEEGRLEQAAALQRAEQQMILIHDEYKKLLREKEVRVLCCIHWNLR